MKLISNKHKKIFVLTALLFILAGCARITGPDGKTLPEKVIYLTTTWGEMFSSESWFTALFTYPIAQAINLLTPYVGVVMAILLVTVLVNLVILPLSIKSTAGTQKMQLVQPEMDKIQKKYEGKDDERSRILMSQEINNLYKKYDIHPFATIGGTFITIPIILAMYQAVIRADAVVNGTFMGVDLQFSPRQALSEGGKAAVVCLVIFVLMAISQFCVTNVPRWLAENKNKKDHKIKSYTETSSAAQQTKTMNYTMLAMIVLMGFTFPTAMSVYWTVNSIVNIVKTVLIQKLVVEKG